MNFEVTRELDCFRQSVGHIRNAATNRDCVIKPVDTNAIREAQHYCDFNPSWQNSMESIERGISELECLGAFMDDKMVGYTVFDIHTGDLSQLAVQGSYRRRGVASRLLQEVVERLETDFIKALNISSDNPGMKAFLQSKNISAANNQYEMILSL